MELLSGRTDNSTYDSLMEEMTWKKGDRFEPYEMKCEII